MHYFCRKVTIMTTPVERNSRKPLRRHESVLPNNKKAKLGHKHVTVQLNTPFTLFDCALHQHPFPIGSLVQLSTYIGVGTKVAAVVTEYLIWEKISCEIRRINGAASQDINISIKISGLYHHELEKFLKDDQIVFPTGVLDFEIKKRGAPADNNNITYEIVVLATDYFERLKTAEVSLRPFLPPPLRHLVRAYIS